jgi:hypothetical protein
MRTISDPGLFLKQVEHRSIAFAVPFLFLMSAARMISAAVPGAPGPAAFFFMAAAVAGLSQLGLSAIFGMEKAKGPAQVRAFFLALTLAYAVAVAFNPKPFPARIALALAGYEAIFAFAVQWLWTGSIQSLFFYREELLRDLSGKTGGDLSLAMRDESELTLVALNGVRAARRGMTVTICLLIAVALVAFYFGRPLDVAAFWFAAGFCAFALLLRSLTHHFEDEQYFAGLGFHNAFSLGGKRFLQAAAVIAVALAVSFLISADSSLLPLAWLAAIINAIGYLFRGHAAIGDSDSINVLSRPQWMDELLKAEASKPGKKPIDLNWLFTGLKYLALAAGVAAVLYFLFGSFFGKKFRSFLRENRLGRYWMTFLDALKSAFRFLVRGRERDTFPRLSVGERRTAANAILALAGKKKSAEKKREIGSLTVFFLDVVAWGTARGCPYRPSTAPGEYSRFLAVSAARLASALFAVGALFEKALYSDELLSGEETARFEKAATEILADEIDDSGKAPEGG